MDKHDRVLAGSAGEHYVLYRLHLAGIHAAQTPTGTKDTDILVFPAGGQGVRLQVKTRTKEGGRGWVLHERHGRLADPWFFYAFVDLESGPHTAYVLPSRVVAHAVAAMQSAREAAGAVHKGHGSAPSIRLLEPAPAVAANGFPPGWMEPHREDWRSLDVGRHPVTPAAPAISAAEVLMSLVGHTITTVEGRPNTVLGCDGVTAIVGTERSPAGQPVKVAAVQAALDRLTRDGFVEVNSHTLGFHAAVCGAVLGALPGVGITLRPAVARLL